MIFIVVGTIAGIICALIASSKGRNAIGWFFVGFFFGIFGVIVALVASNIKAREEKELALVNENRRLQEQIHQERIKLEQFRTHAQKRLDTHDGILNIDTRHVLNESDYSKQPILNAQPESDQSPVPIPPTIESPTPKAIPEEGWYYQEVESAVGPFDRRTILSYLRMGRISLDTNVWHESIKNWTPANQIACLQTGD